MHVFSHRAAYCIRGRPFPEKPRGAPAAPHGEPGADRGAVPPGGDLGHRLPGGAAASGQEARRQPACQQEPGAARAGWDAPPGGQHALQDAPALPACAQDVAELP
eukprot:scaffold298812_cov36-Prasinocladus_malaysianus.AAC.1